MCQTTPGEIRAEAICYFRFFVYREYREIRYLGNPDRGRYDKFSERYSDLYELDRRSFARLWYEVVAEREPSLIAKPFREKTGLSLHDVEEAFRRGEWYPFDSPQKNYGGPKHAEIALQALRLGDAIAAGSWTNVVPQELDVLREIQHNRPRPARRDYESLLDDLRALRLAALSLTDCCLLKEPGT